MLKILVHSIHIYLVGNGSSSSIIIIGQHGMMHKVTNDIGMHDAMGGYQSNFPNVFHLFFNDCLSKNLSTGTAAPSMTLNGTTAVVIAGGVASLSMSSIMLCIVGVIVQHIHPLFTTQYHTAVPFAHELPGRTHLDEQWGIVVFTFCLDVSAIDMGQGGVGDVYSFGILFLRVGCSVIVGGCNLLRDAIAEGGDSHGKIHHVIVALAVAMRVRVVTVVRRRLLRTIDNGTPPHLVFKVMRPRREYIIMLLLPFLGSITSAALLLMFLELWKKRQI
mmetsp:Transcript_28644/g.61104  ORF Transcript_28644/g.61104 Transcript_28644/m.61104 type:complete len:275 (-) Transcript_28644:222-1046(-)